LFYGKLGYYPINVNDIKTAGSRTIRCGLPLSTRPKRHGTFPPLWNRRGTLVPVALTIRIRAINCAVRVVINAVGTNFRFHSGIRFCTGIRLRSRIRFRRKVVVGKTTGYKKQENAQYAAESSEAYATVSIEYYLNVRIHLKYVLP
jgi:hypothetical protein